MWFTLVTHIVLFTEQIQFSERHSGKQSVELGLTDKKDYQEE